MDERYFKSHAMELDSKLGRITSLVDKHGPSVGTYHEYIVKDLLRSILPNRFSLKTGFIYVDEKNISDQIDILIIDENEGSGILAKYDDFVITYPETVVAAIEVKTTFNQDDFVSASRNIQNIKKLSKIGRQRDGMIGGFIFGFDGAELSPMRLDAWYKLVQIESFNEYPDSIISLKRGMLTKWGEADLIGHYFVLENEKDELKWKSLSIFIASLIKFCELQSGIKRNPFNRYTWLKDLLMSKEYCKYGVGLIKK